MGLYVRARRSKLLALWTGGYGVVSNVNFPKLDFRERLDPYPISVYRRRLHPGYCIPSTLVCQMRQVLIGLLAVNSTLFDSQTEGQHKYEFSLLTTTATPRKTSIKNLTCIFLTNFANGWMYSVCLTASKLS